MWLKKLKNSLNFHDIKLYNNIPGDLKSLLAKQFKVSLKFYWKYINEYI